MALSFNNILQGIVRPSTAINHNQDAVTVALFNPDGTPFTGGSGEPVTVEIADVTGLQDALDAKADATDIPASARLVPTGGTSGQVLKVGTDGTPGWGADANTVPATGTDGLITTGTDTTQRTWTAKMIKDAIDAAIAAAAG